MNKEMTLDQAMQELNRLQMDNEILARTNQDLAGILNKTLHDKAGISIQLEAILASLKQNQQEEEQTDED